MPEEHESAKALREKRAEVYASMKTLSERANDPDHDWSAEDEQEWTRCNAEYDAYTRRIDVVERAAELDERHQRRPSDRRIGREDADPRNDDPDRPEDRQRSDEEVRGLALQAWFRHQSGEDLEPEHEEACRATGLNPRRRNLDFFLPRTDVFRPAQREFQTQHPTRVRRALEGRDLSSVVGATGGVTVPESFVNQLEINMLAFGGLLQVADVIRTDRGDDMPWPTADDTGNTGVQLGESNPIGDSVDPSFGAIVWKAYKFSSKLVKIPVELLEDSAFDLPSVLGEMLGERLGRIQNSKFTTGSGAGTPRGVVTGATLGVTAAGAAAITADELIDLQYALDPARRMNARYMFHDNVLLAVRKLKDGQGQYLFQSNAQQGAPDTLVGRPYTINLDMASAIASGNKTVLFGDFRKYKVRQVRGVRLRRLTERYADTDQEGFVAFVRSDGNLLDAGTAPIVYLQQA